MSYNGSGTFVINTAGQPVVSGTVISSTAFNALTADLATGLSTAITKDGQTTPTANIPMGNNKITGLAVGTAATDAANLSQVQSTTAKLITASGTDTVTGTLSPTLTAYAAGQMFYWVAAGTNTGAVTLNIDSLGAKAVTRDGSTALAAGDIRSGEVVVVVYDGTRFQVVSQINSAGDATFANVSITSALNVGGVSTFTGLITANGGVSGALNGTVGATTPNTGSFTTLTTSSTVTLNGGTANGVLYLNGSKVATSGANLTYNGSAFGVSNGTQAATITPRSSSAGGLAIGTDVASSGHVLNLAGDIVGGGTGGGVNIAYYSSSSATWNAGLSIRNTASTYSNLILMQDGGNVGIGTSSPGQKLHVENSANSSTWTKISNGNSGSGAAAGVLFGTDQGDAGALSQNSSNAGYGTAANALRVRNLLNAPITLETNGSERVRLSADGNLGLGVTPSAGAASTNASPQLQLGSAMTMFGFSTSTNRQANIACNAYYDNANNFKYINTDAATAYRQLTGAHAWFTAPSGTAGNAITFTQAMTLDASGNLLVGTTTANGKISLYGTAAATQVTIDGTGRYKHFEAYSSGTRRFYTGFDETSLVGYMQTDGAHPLAFYTNGNERARITAGGYSKFSNAGTYAGSTSLYHELRQSDGNNEIAVFSSSNATLSGTVSGIQIVYPNASPNTTDRVFLYCADSTAVRATIRSNGGLANYQANDVNLSDQRVKKDVKPLGSMWDKFKAIEIVTFKYNDQTHDDNNIGVIAQQVESVAPEFIDVDGFGETPEGEEPLKTVYTTDMYHAAIKALQEAMARIEKLEAEVAALKGA